MPEGAHDPAGNKPELARLHDSLPLLSLSGALASPGPRPAAVGCGPLLTGLSLPSGGPHTRPDPGGRALLGLRLPSRVPSPYSRCLSGGCHSAVTCPDPRKGSADQLITRGRAGGWEAGGRASSRRAHCPATPPSVACAGAAAPPTRRPRLPSGPAHLPWSRAARLRRPFPACVSFQSGALLLSMLGVWGWPPYRGAASLFVFLTIPQGGKRRAFRPPAVLRPLGGQRGKAPWPGNIPQPCLPS